MIKGASLLWLKAVITWQQCWQVYDERWQLESGLKESMGPIRWLHYSTEPRYQEMMRRRQLQSCMTCTKWMNVCMVLHIIYISADPVTLYESSLGVTSLSAYMLMLSCTAPSVWWEETAWLQDPLCFFKVFFFLFGWWNSVIDAHSKQYLYIYYTDTASFSSDYCF